MLSTREEIQTDFKQICRNKEDTVNYLLGWLKYVNASKAKKQELQSVIEEIKWILEAGDELQSGIDRFLGVK